MARGKGGRRGHRDDGGETNPWLIGGGFMTVALVAMLLTTPPANLANLELRMVASMKRCLDIDKTVGMPCELESALSFLEQGADPNTRKHAASHPFGYHLSHLAAGSHMEHGPQLLRALIDAGVDVNAKATKGDRRSPLYVAAVNSRVEQARMLLEAGALVDQGDKLDTSPLFIAAQDGDAPMVELLLAHGAEPSKPTKEGWYAHNVAASECLELRNDRKVCEHGAPGQHLCKHLHPVEVGVAHFANVVRMLLEAGADATQQDVEGSPALHYAIWCESVAMTEILIKHGADVNKPALTGEPPLWVAARKGDMGMVNLLLEAGADPVQTTEASADERAEAGAVGRRNSMWFPAEIASSNGHHEVAKRINAAVDELSKEAAFEMGTDVADIRDTVRPKSCNRMMDLLSEQTERCASKNGCGTSEAEKLFPMVTSTTPPSLPRGARSMLDVAEKHTHYDAPPPPPPPQPPPPKPSADLRTAISLLGDQAAPLGAPSPASTLDTLLQSGEALGDLPLYNYPPLPTADRRIALMRLALWATASATTASFYGLDPEAQGFEQEQERLMQRSQTLLGAGNDYVLAAFEDLDGTCLHLAL